MKVNKNFIYVTTNLVNGKQYIGSHYGRESDSYLGSGAIFKNALKKYGKENFIRDILIECEINDNLILEQKYISDLNTLYPNGYNLTKNGGFNIFTEELRSKLSNKKKGRVGPNKGKKFSEETRRKMSEARKGIKLGSCSEEIKEKIRQSNLGKKRSIETKRKLSKSLSGRKLSEQTKEKMSNFQKGRIKSEEERKNISESKKGQKNPIYGKNPWNKGKTGFKHSEKTKQKMRESHKRNYN